MKIQPVVLTGRCIRLEPLSLEHLPDLSEAGRDESIWQFMLYGPLTTSESMRAWIEDMLQRQAALGDLPFAVILLESERAIGCTRLLEVNLQHKSLEIGGTWYDVQHQRTAVNTESKYLLLCHAFESLGFMRVQFKTDQRNLRSQKAIERLGAVKEGVFRSHMATPSGIRRDSVFYSIIRSEWPAVKENLENKLNSKT
jgi:N-acetyltransferase